MTTVICAGVAVLDLIMYLNEMPRHAEKYRARDAAMAGGGCAANAAVAIARLGGTAHLAARIGGDQVGDLILDGLERDGVDCTLVRRFADRRSSFSSIFIDDAGERQIVNFRDTQIDMDGAWLAQVPLPDFDAAVADTRWHQGAAALLRIACQRGKPAVLDAEAPFDDDGDSLMAATHIAFSVQGLRAYADTDDVVSALRKAHAATGAWVCVTQGGEGVTWLEGDTPRHMSAFRVAVIDTLGAGDVWHGAFALALGEGQSETDAIRFANATAAIKCTRRGGRAGVPTRLEVDAFLQKHSPPAAT